MMALFLSIGMTIIGPVPQSAVMHEIVAICAEEQVPPDVVLRLLRSESGMDQYAYNPDDPSYGIAQLQFKYLDFFADHFNDGIPINPSDPVTSVRVAIRYLAYIHRELGGGSWYWSVIAYKTGLGRIYRAPFHIQRLAHWITTGVYR